MEWRKNGETDSAVHIGQKVAETEDRGKMGCLYEFGTGCIEKKATTAIIIERIYRLSSDPNFVTV
jgi:hypothetical protein